MSAKGMAKPTDNLNDHNLSLSRSHTHHCDLDIIPLPPTHTHTQAKPDVYSMHKFQIACELEWVGSCYRENCVNVH